MAERSPVVVITLRSNDHGTHSNSRRIINLEELGPNERQLVDRMLQRYNSVHHNQRSALQQQQNAAAIRQRQMSMRNMVRNQRRIPDVKELKMLPVYECDHNCSYQQKFADCDLSCAICLCESEDTEKLMVLPCSHGFHEACLMPWLKTHNSCPVCRFELEIEDPVQEKARKIRMKKQYGPERMKLMTVCNQLRRDYSIYQQWKESPASCPVSLKRLKGNVKSKRDKANHCVNHTRSQQEMFNHLKEECITRSNTLIEMIDQSIEQNPSEASSKKIAIKKMKQWGSKIIHSITHSVRR